MQSVLVGVDRSEGSLRAAQFAAERSRINNWDMTIVHVIYWSPFSFQTLEENEQRPRARREEIEQAQAQVIDPLLAQLRDSGHITEGGVAATVLHGVPADVLAEMATEDGHDLIVVGRTGHGGSLREEVHEAVFGTTTSRLVRHAPVPVVVVP